MNKVFRFVRSPRARGVAAVGALSSMGAAHAAVPEAVTTAITAAGNDLVTVVTAIIVAMVAFWGLRKVGQKFGWI